MFIKDLMHFAVQASFEAAKEILRIYEGAIEVDMKSDGSPLTAADKAAHVAISKVLAETGLPILSEEGKDIPYEERRKWTMYWLVDPLDGTKEFIKRNGEFTVNIALMESDHPVAGVICQPVKGVAFAGLEGKLYKFSENVPVSFDQAPVNLLLTDQSPITRIVASRSHKSAETEQFISQLEASGKKIELMNAGSALKFCVLAEGKADIYPRFAPTMEWDTAAGHALLKAAGKNIYLQRNGREMTYNKPQLVNDWFIAR